MSVSDYCAERGGVYLELLTSAYDPRLQAAAYLAGFLPCGYFLAAARDHYSGRREDIVVTSKTFVPLHFAGLRLTAHRDGNEDTTLRGIDVSTDGAAWTEVYAARGDCAGTTACDVIAQAVPIEFAFGPVDAQYVRVRSGPTRFALAEVELAVIGN